MASWLSGSLSEVILMLLFSICFVLYFCQIKFVVVVVLWLDCIFVRHFCSCGCVLMSLLLCYAIICNFCLHVYQLYVYALRLYFMYKSVHDSKCKDLSTHTDQTARQHRANERSDIFRHFTGSIYTVICRTLCGMIVTESLYNSRRIVLCVCLSSPSSAFPAARTRALTPQLASTGPYGVTPIPSPTYPHFFN